MKQPNNVQPQEAHVMTVARNATRVGPPVLITIISGRSRLAGATFDQAHKFLDDLQALLVTRGGGNGG